jgi:predicted deacylase
VNDVLRRWKKVAKSARLEMKTLGEEGGFPVVTLVNARAGAGEPGLYLSAGIHGDEPGAVAGLLEWAERQVAFLAVTPVVIAPCLNPWGLANNSRVDHAGRDLNRMFDNGGAGALRPLLRLLRGLTFKAAVSLHEDCRGGRHHSAPSGKRGRPALE